VLLSVVDEPYAVVRPYSTCVVDASSVTHVIVVPLELGVSCDTLLIAGGVVSPVEMSRLHLLTHGMLTLPAPSKLSGCTINRECDINGAGLGNGASELLRVPSNQRSKNVT